MAFTGDLAHLPIVDLIQLMNSTRKSGLLTVTGRKGQSQLIFKDGYIVSASHLNNSIRIGQVLVEMGFVSDVQIEEGLNRQKLDGENRRPLAITLIELGILSEQNAYKALQHLIEITIVEILTWKSGKFTLDHLKDVIDCDFRYYPARMDHEINVNTQGILMDALRIFDEKVRDGLIVDEPDESEKADDEIISADDLGLSEIDQIDPLVPNSFTAVVPFDPLDTQRRKIAELAPELQASEKEKLAIYLARFTKEKDAPSLSGTQQVVLNFSDMLLCHAVRTCLTDQGFAVSLEKLPAKLNGDSSWLVTDRPFSSVESSVIFLCGEVKAMLEAYRSGAAAVMPRPAGHDYTDRLVLLLETLPVFLKNQR